MLSPAIIYPFLASLSKAGYVTSKQEKEGGRVKILYSMTPEGRRFSRRVFKRLSMMVSTAIMSSSVLACANCGCKLYEKGYEGRYRWPSNDVLLRSLRECLQRVTGEPRTITHICSIRDSAQELLRSKAHATLDGFSLRDRSTEWVQEHISRVSEQSLPAKHAGVLRIHAGTVRPPVPALTALRAVALRYINRGGE